jgi:transcriptional activator of cad operon
VKWQIESFIFCERQQTLSVEDNTIQLEPAVVELLSYFCRHSDQIIHRDELINEVWQGRIVTDNAVTKTITKLRKYFDDNPRKPSYIATFPKKGYRFIAAVKQVVEAIEPTSISTPLQSATSDNPEQGPLDSSSVVQSHLPKNIAQPDAHPRSSFKLLSAFLLTLIAVAFFANMFFNTSNSVHPTLTKVKALTRDAGSESRAQVSPNGQYLGYVEFQAKKMRVWIKSLVTQETLEVSHGEAESTWVDSISWNSDGSEFVYLVTTPTSCRYFIRAFNGMKISEAKLIHNCPQGSYGKIAFTHDDHRLIYSEARERHQPFELFELNLQTNNKKRLNQPALFLGGNSQFDLHPTENKLLISSVDQQQWEGFYSLDLDTEQLTLLFKQDAFICCGIWSHDGKRVVLMGEHPATQIVSFDLNGGNKQIIYSGSEQVRVPERHSNGVDYLFSVAKINQDALFYDFSNETSVNIANTSVDDRLATFSSDSAQIAYISLSSGSEQVWLTDKQAKQHKKLTQLTDNRYFMDLSWSPNSAYLAGLAFNEILIINAQTGATRKLKLPQVEIRAMSWKNDHTVAYSIKQSSRWRVQNYDIHTDEVTLEAKDWQYIQYTNQPDNRLWLDQDNQLFYGQQKTPVTDATLKAVDFLNSRTFNLRKHGSTWAWQQPKHRQYQLKVKTLDQPEKVVLMSDSLHFDLSKTGLLYHTQVSLDADIYQTVH